MYFFGNTYFPEFLIKSVFQLLFCAILITESTILFFTVWNRRKTAPKKEKHDKGSMLLMIIGYWMSIFLNPICVKLSTRVFPLMLFWIGAALIVAGIFVRIYSVWTLKEEFTLNVQVGSKQEIIKSGPYKYIRHPAYTGSILTLFGVAFSFRSLLGIIAVAIITAIVYGYRIKIEETLLEQSFGNTYKDYEKKTWRLIPYIW